MQAIVGWQDRPPPIMGGIPRVLYKPPSRPHGVIVVVEYYCFLINIIDVGVVRVADVSYGLFCMHIKNGGFVYAKRCAAVSNRKAPGLNNELSVLYWLARMDRVALLLVVFEYGSP